MVSAVWRYTLEEVSEQQIVMPRGAELLHVQAQHGKISLWARVGLIERRDVRRLILVRGTGHPVEDQPHVGTAVTEDGLLVWHVFDGGETPLPDWAPSE